MSMLRAASCSLPRISSCCNSQSTRFFATFEKYDFLSRLGLKRENEGVFDGKTWRGSGDAHNAMNPTTNEVIAQVKMGSLNDYEICLENMEAAKKSWAAVPPPIRGNVVRQIGNALRENLNDLGALISLEMGKIRAEGVGEVQSFVNTCDLAVGISRQLPGTIFPSERANHAMFESWSPLGNVGIISAFNFPNAVFGWNSAISLVCGNTQIWKPAPSSSLLAIATQKIINRVLEENKIDTRVATLCCGGADIAKQIAKDPRVDLVSFTGSVRVGRELNKVVAERLGRAILELGGNNAIIVMDDADLEMAKRTVLFAAVGTAGQRCTSLRRLYIHEKVYSSLLDSLVSAYKTVPMGNPLDATTLLGPLHNPQAVQTYLDVVSLAQKQGGKVLVGGKKVDRPGNFVEPTIIEIDHTAGVVQEEAFVPIIYVMKIKSMDEGIEKNNSVKQGLSSSLFSNSMHNVFKWIGPLGSDTGIVNVNTSCSGAEIGGAFGGNKDTGGGREVGSDSWKQYMRRSTVTINYGKDLPLAQGIKFA